MYVYKWKSSIWHISKCICNQTWRWYTSAVGPTAYAVYTCTCNCNYQTVYTQQMYDHPHFPPNPKSATMSALRCANGFSFIPNVLMGICSKKCPWAPAYACTQYICGFINRTTRLCACMYTLHVLNQSGCGYYYTASLRILHLTK